MAIFSIGGVLLVSLYNCVVDVGDDVGGCHVGHLQGDGVVCILIFAEVELVKMWNNFDD